MGNCKDCKSWEHHTDMWKREWHECAIDWVDPGNPVGEAEAAIYAEANDDSSLVAGLVTGPMFGCVRFQLKSRIKEEN